MYTQGETPSADTKTYDKLIKLCFEDGAPKRNLAEDLDEEKLTHIGQEVVHGYQIDLESRKDWDEKNEEAMKLALQMCEAKSWPWPNASNVKFPLITVAAIQFNARAYPAIIQGNRVVKCKPLGKDPDGLKEARAERVSDHMSYQFLDEMENWQEETDKLLMNIPIVGCAFRKTYFDAAFEVNRSELVFAKDLIVNHNVKSLESARRITQHVPLYKNDVIERQREGRFLEKDIPFNEEDPDGQCMFLEQHCWYDFDEDNYREPYVVTVHKDSMQVVRIVPNFTPGMIHQNDKDEIARIDTLTYYTKYGFLRNPDGGFYDIGFGFLMNHLNETVNTIINQLIDAGTLANSQGGFIGSGLRLKSGPVRFSPGEYKPVHTNGPIRDNIYKMDFGQPSPVLFQLLGLLIDASKDISNVKDVLTGEQNQSNIPATTTLALIEQGLKTYSAIFKRIYLSLTDEFRKVFKLNSLYLPIEKYLSFHDVDGINEDYKPDRGIINVLPVADPDVVTNTQVLAKAEALLKFIGDPSINQYELRKRYLVALREDNYETLLINQEDPVIQQVQEQTKTQLMEPLQAAHEELAQNEKALQQKEAELRTLEKSLTDRALNIISKENDIKSKENALEIKSQINKEDAQIEVAKIKEDGENVRSGQQIAAKLMIAKVPEQIQETNQAAEVLNSGLELQAEVLGKIVDSQTRSEEMQVYLNEKMASVISQALTAPAKITIERDSEGRITGGKREIA